MRHNDLDCSAGGGAGGLPHRYCFGGGYPSRHTLHPFKIVAKRAAIPAIMATFKYLTSLLPSRVLLVMCLSVAAWPVEANPLRLGDLATVDVWPMIRILADPDGVYSAAELVDQPERFIKPVHTPSNLGRRDETIWLRASFVVPESTDVKRLLAIDYPPLNEIDFYTLHDGRVHSHQRMGNQLQQNERAMNTRLHAAPIPSAPGEYELLLRVRTLSSMVLPITIRTQEEFAISESRVHLVQGFFFGLALCMLLYSLAHAFSLRDLVFLDYALLLVGNSIFSLSYFGIGAQYLWPDWPQVSMQIAPMGIMIAIAAGTRFIRATLAVHKVSPSVDLVLRVVGATALFGLVATLLGIIEYRSAQTLVIVLGIVVTVMVIPVAAIHARRGERDAAYILLGWSFYSIGAIAMAGILRGIIEPNAWTQHVYPLSNMIEMTTWMAVLGRRVKIINSNADRARVESDTLRAMAHTDVLTGLPNRRGLNAHLDSALSNASADQMVAIYLMDLDGFKPVNDRYGHDVGDALLVAVGERLRLQLRSRDVVSRLGGDEFVVLVDELPDEATALSVGQKLLIAFNEPFEVAAQRCEVGVTIGYALAPLDGIDSADLLKHADAAMYDGKRQGRRRVQRGGPVMVNMADITQ